MFKFTKREEGHVGVSDSDVTKESERPNWHETETPALTRETRLAQHFMPQHWKVLVLFSLSSIQSALLTSLNWFQTHSDIVTFLSSLAYLWTFNIFTRKRKKKNILAFLHCNVLMYYCTCANVHTNVFRLYKQAVYFVIKLISDCFIFLAFCHGIQSQILLGRTRS